MMFLLFFFVASIGSAVADCNTVWTEEMLQDVFSNAASNVTKSAPELIAENNYTVEVRHVTTEDGYILEMHRIPASPTSPAAEDKPVVFLMHGVLHSSASWVISGSEKGFGYILADAGYDVWMGNARGNTYSRNHTTADISSEEFWDFSWHEIGYYDLPAMIDYILSATGQDQVVYIGHSQGTTTFYVMASMRTEYNDKIKGMFSLAPVAYVGNNSRALASFTNTSSVIEQFGIYEFSPSTAYLSGAAAELCNNDTLSQFVCSDVIFIVGGYNPAQLDISMLPIIFAHVPAGASVYQMAHYGQLLQSKKFRQYDHGLTKNMARYSSPSPPDYDLSLITASVYLVYSKKDAVSSVKDITRLHKELGNSKEMVQVPDEQWTHFDYIWGIGARELIYEPMLEKLRSMRN